MLMVDATKQRACASAINEMITIGDIETGEISDGYHTFKELYYHRAILFSIICAQFREISWKSRQHHDGSMFEDMFIVGINTPKGQATYHFENNFWELFSVKELDRAPEWDGHTPFESIARISSLV